MMTSSNGNIFRVTGHLCGNSPVPGEFHTQRPVTRSFDVYFDLRPNKRLSKQSWSWWFETPSRPFWRHRNVLHLWHLWSHYTDEFYHGLLMPRFHLNFEHYHRKLLSACGLWRHPGAVTTMVQTAKYDFKSIWTWCRCWFLIGWCPQSIAGMWHVTTSQVTGHSTVCPMDCLGEQHANTSKLLNTDVGWIGQPPGNSPKKCH